MTSTLPARSQALALIFVAFLSSSLALKVSAQDTVDPVLELKREVGRLVMDGVNN